MAISEACAEFSLYYQHTSSVMWSFKRENYIISSAAFSPYQNMSDVTSRLNQVSPVNLFWLQLRCLQFRCSVSYLLYTAELHEVNGLQTFGSRVYQFSPLKSSSNFLAGHSWTCDCVSSWIAVLIPFWWAVSRYISTLIYW